ncbi:MAG: zf-HC2 domain-containing protein [Flavobacteriales bacterium]|nr:zf-HC2 domain-containing protein [Flavobacteriales bacterium]
MRELRALALRERVGLWMHLRVCTACRAYRKQSRMIDRWLERRANAGSTIQSEALETRIIDAIARRS